MENEVYYDNRIFKYLRIAQGYTVNDLSRIFGISHSHILRIENGVKKPSERLVQLYCETFKVSERLLNYFHHEIKETENKKGVISWQEILLMILKVICKETEI